MNCFEFRRLCLSIPDSGNSAYIVHAEECADCWKYADGVRRMDDVLLEALSVPIPEDLVARLKLRTVIDREQNRRGNGMRFAIAASLVLAVAASIFGYQNWSINQDYQRLSEAVVNHVEHEHSVTGRTTVNAPQELASMFLDHGAVNALAMSDVVFTMLCPVNGKQSIHAVISTNSGPMTLIFVPGTTLPEIRDTEYDGLNNYLVPMGGGVLILAADSSESFEEVTNEVQRAVEWEI